MSYVYMHLMDPFWAELSSVELTYPRPTLWIGKSYDNVGRLLSNDLNSMSDGEYLNKNMQSDPNSIVCERTFCREIMAGSSLHEIPGHTWQVCVRKCMSINVYNTPQSLSFQDDVIGCRLRMSFEVTCEWLVDCLLCKREGGVLCTK